MHTLQYCCPADFFPAGCRWRNVGALPSTRLAAFSNDEGKAAARETWRVQQYEYWDDVAEDWVSEQPAACRLRPLALQEWQGSPGWQQLQLEQQEVPSKQQQPPELPGLQHHYQQQHQEQQFEEPQRQQQEQRWPASGGGCSEAACMYTNLWYNQGRFYFLSEGQAAQKGNWAMSKNR
jgi:hypothetical protein